MGGFLKPSRGPVEFCAVLDFGGGSTVMYAVRKEWRHGSPQRIDYVMRKRWADEDEVVGTRPLTASNSAAAAAWVCSQTLNNVTDKCNELVWVVDAEVSFPDLPDVALHWNLRTYLPTGGRLDADADDYHGEIMRADQEERTQEYNRLAMEQRLLSMAELWRLSDPVL